MCPAAPLEETGLTASIRDASEIAHGDGTKDLEQRGSNRSKTELIGMVLP